jgi:hypothetical protein
MSELLEDSRKHDLTAAQCLVTLFGSPQETEGEELRAHVGALWLIEALRYHKAWVEAHTKR